MSGTVFARGVNKTLCIAQEAAFGVQSAATGQLVRRTNAAFNLSIQPIESQEILPSQQERDWRLGTRSVNATLSAQLSPGSFASFFQGLLRSPWTAGSTISGLTDTAVAPASSADQSTLLVGLPQTPQSLSSVATNFSTAGFKSGDIFRITAIGPAQAALINTNYSIVGFDGGGKDILAIGPTPNVVLPNWTLDQYGAVSLAVPGKKLKIPATGQIAYSFTFEEWYSDIGQSRLFTGCRVTQISLNMPPSGFVTMQASITGQQQTTGGVQQYPSASPVDTETSLTAVSGAVLYRGVPILFVTSMNLTIKSNTEAPPVVGSNISPYIFQGTLMVQGSLSCFLANDVLQADYLNEAEVAIDILLTTSPLPTADFINIYLPRVKLSGTTINDSDMSITRNFNFMALENVGSNVFADLTTIVVQDSTVS